MKIWFPVIKAGSGTDVFTRRLAAALESRGIQAEITWFESKYEFAPFLLRFVPAPVGTTIIHANAWNGFAFARTGIPLVVTEHQGWFGANHRPYRSRMQQFYHEQLIRRYVLASCKAASRVTTVSRFSATGMEETLGIRDSYPIYNWVDTNTFSPSSVQNEGTDKPFKLLFVGNFTFLKGSDLLVRIMRELGGKFQLSFTTGLKDLPTSEVPDNMVSVGRLSSEAELVQAYRNCDALLFPSRFEGFGYAVLEAMACGKPVIASNTAALPEVIESHMTGILCAPDNLEAFVDGCKYLAGHSNICRLYGNAGRRRAVDFFSEDATIKRYIELYSELGG